MLSEATFPLESLDKLLAAADEGGIAREMVLGSAEPQGGGLRFEELAAAYETAARLTGDDAFGLHVGERTAARMYGLPGYLLAHARTLGDALENMVEFQRLWSQAAGFHVERDRGAVRLRYWHGGCVPAEARRQESEQMLSAMIGILRDALGERISPLEVRFEHRLPADITEHVRIFGCRLAFEGGATELALPAALLQRPLPNADPALAGLVRRQAEAELGSALIEEPFLRRLRLLAGAAVAGLGDTSLEGLAAAMRTGPRTLQRRLKELGLSHRALVEAERMALARRLLADPRQTLGSIAFRLGYSQPSAFHRAFRRHSGVTPQHYRTTSPPPHPSSASARMKRSAEASQCP
jgi:AraC-like DNA-binding protein